MITLLANGQGVLFGYFLFLALVFLIFSLFGDNEKVTRNGKVYEKKETIIKNNIE